ncbi:DedA family protein [Natronorarus salvus]|uniref:DedA family protein n=1 Tax=Natronorarus salvus TaxID=3117733 RepID=UPI002F260686
MDAIVDPSPAVWSMLEAIGVPLILVLFYFDGMVVGKVTPPAALFVAYVALATPPTSVLVLLAAASVAASTLGQWTLYRGFNEESPEFFGIRRRVPYADRLPFVVRSGVGERRMAFVTRYFDRFGGAALCLTNAVPLVRNLMSIPAGLSHYPVGRFLLFSAAGNTLYLGALVAIAFGLLETARFLPVP